MDPDCTAPRPPESLSGRGVGFAMLNGDRYLFDVDATRLELLGAACQDGLRDYEIAHGTCASMQPVFDYFQAFNQDSLPLAICVRRADGSALFDFRVESADGGTVLMTREFPAAFYENSTLAAVPMPALIAGQQGTLRITATDGHTPVVEAAASFLYQGETTLVFHVIP